MRVRLAHIRRKEGKCTVEWELGCWKSVGKQQSLICSSRIVDKLNFILPVNYHPAFTDIVLVHFQNNQSRNQQ